VDKILLPKSQPKLIVTEIECNEPLDSENLKEDIFEFFFKAYLKKKEILK